MEKYLSWEEADVLSLNVLAKGHLNGLESTRCHKYHNVTNVTNVTSVTILPEGGLVSCEGSQQCHTLWQEDGFDGLTPDEAFGSGDHHD